MTKRFWVMGPVDVNGKEMWGVVDGNDLPGMRAASKPAGYQEFHHTEFDAEAHAGIMNYMLARKEQPKSEFPWCVKLIRGDYVVAQFRTETKARDYARQMNIEGRCRSWKAAQV